jgi:hypothetical protein
MAIRRLFVALAFGLAMVLIPINALALDCRNLSRPGSIQGLTIMFSVPETTPGGVVVAYLNIYAAKGNWYLFTVTDPSGTTLEGATWGFIPPGSLGADPAAALFPGSNGNYQAGVGFALLDTAACPGARQTAHGIQVPDGCGVLK